MIIEGYAQVHRNLSLRMPEILTDEQVRGFYFKINFKKERQPRARTAVRSQYST